ncbi:MULTISPECIES: phthiocerol/phthiodiolone dimycocerosyl transferase family protein [unclassified Streptomyces]|uniref:phthiocerol/phthiodiolone dimycocerosyl transferase family protein n=1 Tax=unclassified Streptomyces TaxID=2593676 RepID=UPI0037BB894B
MHRNPVQFSLVAEIGRRITKDDLARALKCVQERHPLLSVSVDRNPPEPVYRKAQGSIGVETAAAGTPWQAVVATEQTHPIPPEPGPLLRAVLIPGAAGCFIVLTFAHQITDGIGGLRVLLELVAALDGDERGTAHGLPRAQEDLLAGLDTVPTDPRDTAPVASPPEDERMSAPGDLAPFSGLLPHVSALALDPDVTARLVERCRAEGMSVHAALCAAASTVFHRRGRAFVTVLSPVDLRRAAGLPEDVANRFAGARTASGATEADDFWALARGHHEALGRQRSPQALQAGSVALSRNAPATPQDAEAMLAAATAADIQITNLGATEAYEPAGSSLKALWGPAQLTQLRGEHVLGVVTVDGRLRMTELTHDPVAALLPELGAVLAQACTATEQAPIPRDGTGADPA